MMSPLLLLMLALAWGAQVQGNYSDHKYSKGVHVPLYANKEKRLELWNGTPLKHIKLFNWIHHLLGGLHNAADALCSANAQASAPVPMSDRMAVNQGIACMLLFLALALTYLIHPLDAFPYNLL